MKVWNRGQFQNAKNVTVIIQKAEQAFNFSRSRGANASESVPVCEHNMHEKRGAKVIHLEIFSRLLPRDTARMPRQDSPKKDYLCF
jgi:hypothetical protein